MPTYYDAWEPGVFPFQQPLCQALRGSPYSLDEPEVNPLTLQLVGALQEANALDRRVQEASRGLSRLRQEALALWGEAAASGTAILTEDLRWMSTGESQTVAAVALVDGPHTLKTHRPSGQQPFPMMEAQLLLLQFFTHYCAGLDRVAREVDRLFTLGSKPPRWRTLTPWKNGRNRVLLRLRNKDAALSAWLSGLHAAQLAVAFCYLDTLQTLGFLPVKASVDGPSSRWRLWIGPAVQEAPAELTTDAVQLCRTLMKEGLTVINATYHILYRHCEEHGLPPW